MILLFLSVFSWQSIGSFEQIVVNPVLGILIAVVASLVLIVIIIVVVIKFRSNQFDKRNGNKANKGMAFHFEWKLCLTGIYLAQTF